MVGGGLYGVVCFCWWGGSWGREEVVDGGWRMEGVGMLRCDFVGREVLGV